MSKLDYETPSRRPPETNTYDDLLRVGRRLCFAAGVGLVFGGVGAAVAGFRDPAYMMGWGGVLIGLCVPLGPPPVR